MNVSAMTTSSLPRVTASAAVPAAAANTAAAAGTTGTGAAASPATTPTSGSSASAQVPAASASTASSGLVKTGNDEYTADSVSADQKDALALGLVKQKDGNYAAKAADTIAVSRSAVATSSPAVQAALSGLVLGG